MSSIAFHTPDGTVRVSGRERYGMSAVCDNFRRAQMGDVRHDNLKWLPLVLKPGHYLMNDAMAIASDAPVNFLRRSRLLGDLDTAMTVRNGDLFVIDGKVVDFFTLILNSALNWGNRAVQLAAKLHGQCEIHAYCEGVDRAWLADVIQEGIDAGIFRAEPMGYDGWPKVMEMLRSDDSQPVVTSYSVTDSFPNAGLMPEGVLAPLPDGGINWDAWEEIDAAQQWEWSITALRAEKGLRLSPDRLAKPFGDGLDARGFMEKVRKLGETDR